ncbi:MAG: glycosyltransferase family 4 protein [Pseudomonadota bacterium]|nr:glycosyltransferase family 4 protein [Pseudomonadota bacterium]
MHVCHINLARGYRGGERQTELLIRALAARGIQQTLIARAGEPLTTRLADVPELACREANRPFFRQALRRTACELVHAHEAKAAHLAYQMHRLRRLPYVVTRRVPNPLKSNRLTRSVYLNAASVVAISQAVRDTLLHYDARLDPPVIPSASSALETDAARLAELRRRFDRRFVVGHVGALVDKHKGQSVLIETARRLKTTCPKMIFLLIGDGADAAGLRAQAAGLDNVVFEGYVNNVGDYLAVMDMFVFPSREEGLGSILLDAMAFGLPIVASRVGGIPELIADGDNGRLVPPGDGPALAEAVSDLYHDSALRQAFGDRARTVAESFQPGVMAQRYLAIYRQILNKTPEAKGDLHP